MNKDTAHQSAGPEGFEDMLSAVLRQGAQKMLASAIAFKVENFMQSCSHGRPPVYSGDHRRDSGWEKGTCSRERRCSGIC